MWKAGDSVLVKHSGTLLCICVHMCVYLADFHAYGNRPAPNFKYMQMRDNYVVEIRGGERTGSLSCHVWAT